MGDMHQPDICWETSSDKDNLPKKFLIVFLIKFSFGGRRETQEDKLSLIKTLATKTLSTKWK